MTTKGLRIIACILAVLVISLMVVCAIASSPSEFVGQLAK